MGHTTNYRDTFIQVSPDSSARSARVPDKAGSIAELQYRMMSSRPYGLTSDDVVFGVFAERNAIPATEREAAREAFFSRGQACLRCSPLVKTYGWGIHCDGEGRVALVGIDDGRYALLARSEGVAVVEGMRKSRK